MRVFLAALLVALPIMAPAQERCVTVILEDGNRNILAQLDTAGKWAVPDWDKLAVARYSPLVANMGRCIARKLTAQKDTVPTTTGPDFTCHPEDKDWVLNIMSKDPVMGANGDSAGCIAEAE